jgi:uncharacterized membrane protein YfcA
VPVRTSYGSRAHGLLGLWVLDKPHDTPGARAHFLTTSPEAHAAHISLGDVRPACPRVFHEDVRRAKVSGAVVGFFGGMVGGFAAFPGAAVVVWTGLRGLPKAKHRAIVQPYIIMSQIYSLGLVAWLHPSYLNSQFWLLLALTFPAVVPGTLSGLAIYKRMSDLDFKRVTYLLLGISGVALLAKTLGSAMKSLL